MQSFFLFCVQLRRDFAFWDIRNLEKGFLAICVMCTVNRDVKRLFGPLCDVQVKFENFVNQSLVRTKSKKVIN